ncbi:MAG: SCO6745 family protein [Candidatus Dormibacteria bacterium]
MELTRRAWTAYEPIHAVVYFAPEAAEEFTAIGLRGGWMGYFGSRAAPMGEVTAALVTATFHNFAPHLVERAIPDAWRFADRDAILAARLRAADRALRRLWGDAVVEGTEVREAATRIAAVTARLDPAGRPIFAGHAALPAPEAPHLALWHACTLLREHRFDGHVAALTAHGLGGADAFLTGHDDQELDDEAIRARRGWSAEQIAAAVARLQGRGILDGRRHLTEEGRRLRAAVEQVTDAASSPPWDGIDAAAAESLVGLLTNLARRLDGVAGFPYPNPVGVPRPV